MNRTQLGIFALRLAAAPVLFPVLRFPTPTGSSPAYPEVIFDSR